MGLLRRTPPERDVDVLVVCTANVCRSPYIAALLRSALPELTVASAGTAVAAGIGLDPRIAPMLAARGESVRQASGQALRKRTARRARLILTATAEHRDRVIALDPEAGDRTFTLKEFARLLAAPADPASRPDASLDTAIERARRLRCLVRAAEEMAGAVDDGADHGVAGRCDGTADDDLADPFGGDTAAYRRMFTDVEQALVTIVPALLDHQ